MRTVSPATPLAPSLLAVPTPAFTALPRSLNLHPLPRPRHKPRHSLSQVCYSLRRETNLLSIARAARAVVRVHRRADRRGGAARLALLPQGTPGTVAYHRRRTVMSEAPPPPRIGGRVAIILVLLVIAVLGYVWFFTH